MGGVWSAEVFGEFGDKVGAVLRLLLLLLAIEQSFQQIFSLASTAISAALTSRFVGLVTAGTFSTTFRPPFCHQVASGVVDSGLLEYRVSEVRIAATL